MPISMISMENLNPELCWTEG